MTAEPTTSPLVLRRLSASDDLAGALALMTGYVTEIRRKLFEGHGIRLELKRRDTGTPVASLDIPVSLSVRVDELAVKLQPGTIKLDVVK
jgi:hypothetical protein